VPAIPVIGFPRGAGLLAERYARETGADAIGCDTSMPAGWMQRLQVHLPVQGNLDPVLLMAGGEKLDVRVGSILETLGHGPFIFNLGHGILPETPIKHVTRLVSLVKGG
jgi:uroporphyrinogen decarboxylase